MKNIQKLADKGDGIAQLKTGYCYMFMNRPDYGRAYRYFRKSADQDNARAMYFLGELYYHGWGISEDKEKGIDYFRMAVDGGDADAMYALGMMMVSGNNVEKDFDGGFDLLLQACEKGQIMSYNAVGAIYAEGTCLDRDPFKARAYFNKGIAKGDRRAVQNLAYLNNREMANNTPGWTENKE